MDFGDDFSERFLARSESRPDRGRILLLIWDAFATHGDGVCAVIQSQYPLMGRLPDIPGLISRGRVIAMQ
jgi:hypothetical protein